MTSYIPTNTVVNRGASIIQAVATIRDIIAYTEIMNVPVCLLSLDFKDAFDRISHSYVYKILEYYGFSNQVGQRIRSTYNSASSALKIKGTTMEPILIQCSVRQGCPLSGNIRTMYKSVITGFGARTAGVEDSMQWINDQIGRVCG
jgi:hypothetical protein